MKSCKFFQWFSIVAMIGAALWLGCAGSKNKNTIAAEAGFPSQPAADSTKTEKPADRSTDEDDVLRLLGINKSKEVVAKENVPAEPAPETKDAEVAAHTLDDQLAQRDADLAALRAEIAERDRRIAGLQEQLNKSGKESVPSTPMPTGTFKEQYDAARDLYENKKYRQAAAIFEKLIAAGGDKSLLDNCQYWIGECYYGLNSYSQAIVEFEKVFTYSDSDKYDDSQLKLGLCYLRIGNVEKAKSELEKLIANYPDSEYLQRAKEYLARL